ncbi:MAG: transglycosylase SLT domain-containing protein [Rikenellaceae bacterium]
MFNKTLLILAFFNLVSLTTNTVSSTALPRIEGEVNTTSEVSKTVEISPYDSLFRTLSEEQGNDWRLLCAMAYHESRFQPDVVSHCGARGILQVMPNVARQFDVTTEQLYNVEDNIYVANRLMTLIDDTLRLPASTSEENRLKLTLAAYNCGVGRIADARRLARSFGEDSTSWDVVAKYLEKMNNAEYYEHEAVKYGRFKGASQTLAYVRNVVKHYESYCLLAMR